MPIRQSDDYLTARAANPRTGLISPSVAGTPRTLEIPDQAIGISKLNLQCAPTTQTESNIQPEIQKKLCGVGTKSAQSVTWLRDGSCWLQDTRALKMASPIVSGANVHADLLDASHHPGFKEDDFVVKMPSAREPQPYKFPGASVPQIKAFQHYKHKAKRTSGDGYDHRLIDLYREDLDDAHTGQHVDQRPAFTRPQCTAPVPPAHMHIHPAGQPRRFIVPKLRSTVVHNDTSLFREMADTEAVSQPTTRNTSTESNVTAIRHPSKSTTTITIGSPTSITTESFTPIQDTRRTSNDSTTSQATVITSRAPTHLGQLPRVHLVHPSLAGMPIPPIAPQSRKCSLSLDEPGKDKSGISTRRQFSPIVDPSLRTLAQDTIDPKCKPVDTPSFGLFVESVALAFTILWNVVQDCLSSHEQALNQIFPQHLTFREKVLILKSIVVLLAKAMAMFLIVAVMWKIVDVAIQMVRFLFMPLRFLMGLNR